MEIPLSSEDIKRHLGQDVKVIAYPELSKYSDIRKVLGKRGKAVVLYETKHNYGHWVGLHKSPKGGIEVFDSYGFVPDDELKYIDTNFRKINNEMKPHLSHLLYASGLPVEYNNYKFQKMAKDVNTCGRHVVLRLQNGHMNIDQYYKALKGIQKKTGVSPDELVSYLIK